METANSGADVLRLYNKWHEKLEAEEGSLPESGSSHEHKEKKGLLQKVKNAIRGKDEVPIVEKKVRLLILILVKQCSFPCCNLL